MYNNYYIILLKYKLFYCTFYQIIKLRCKIYQNLDKNLMNIQIKIILLTEQRTVASQLSELKTKNVQKAWH